MSTRTQTGAARGLGARLRRMSARLAGTVVLLRAALAGAILAAARGVRAVGRLAAGIVPRRQTKHTQPGEDYVVRFDVHQRIQHILMFSSFLTLAFTGLPQKFHAWTGSQWLIASLGGLEMTQGIHRVAAFVMLADCLYHAIYIVHTVLVRKQFNALRMIPMPKDFFDAVKMFKYFLGFSTEKPKFGRYSYLEKFDYWAVFWGIAIIGGSGLILLMPVQVSRLLPGSIVPVALAAHSDEAVLAVGWIFIVHFFYAHFAPAVFPFNPSIFTGRVPKHRYAEEHPLDVARLGPDAPAPAVEQPPQREAPMVPVAVALQEAEMEIGSASHRARGHEER